MLWIQICIRIQDFWIILSGSKVMLSIWKKKIPLNNLLFKQENNGTGSIFEFLFSTLHLLLLIYPNFIFVDPDPQSSWIQIQIWIRIRIHNTAKKDVKLNLEGFSFSSITAKIGTRERPGGVVYSHPHAGHQNRPNHHNSWLERPALSIQGRGWGGGDRWAGAPGFKFLPGAHPTRQNR